LQLAAFCIKCPEEGIMKSFLHYLAALALTAALLIPGTGKGAGDRPVIADHQCTYLSNIPDSVIDLVQGSLKYHYAHTSHGSQLTAGLSVIESNDARYSYAIRNNALPSEEGALCIHNGQVSDTYITPEEYWETASGMDATRAVLSGNGEINISMWAWCTQLNTYSEAQVRAYLDSISVLEAEFPAVTFVYMTGNAQYDGAEGYNRYLRNEQIRQFCEDNNRVLYDFADLDCWYYNSGSGEWELNTYLYEGIDVPLEHPQFEGEEANHTTWESCEQKGNALWYLSAMMTGWIDTTSSEPYSWGGVKSIFRESEKDSL
jgi:hypothetical protein